MNYAGEVEWKTREFWKKTNRKAIKRTACEKKDKSTKKKTEQKEVNKDGARKDFRRKRLNDEEGKQRKSERE